MACLISKAIVIITVRDGCGESCPVEANEKCILPQIFVELKVDFVYVVRNCGTPDDASRQCLENLFENKGQRSHCQMLIAKLKLDVLDLSISHILSVISIERVYLEEI